MRRLAVLGVAAVLTGLVVGVVVAGSGDDGSSDGTRESVPELAPIPGSPEPGSGSRTERTDTDTTSTDESGGAPAPAEPPADTGGGGAPEDSPQNDTPPPSGSPAERFEQFCEENPGAC